MSDAMWPCCNGHSSLFYGLILEPKQESVHRTLVRICTHAGGLIPLTEDASLNVNEMLPMSVTLEKFAIDVQETKKQKGGIWKNLNG